MTGKAAIISWTVDLTFACFLIVSFFFSSKKCCLSSTCCPLFYLCIYFYVFFSSLPSLLSASFFHPLFSFLKVEKHDRSIFFGKLRELAPSSSKRMSAHCTFFCGDRSFRKWSWRHCRKCRPQLATATRVRGTVERRDAGSILAVVFIMKAKNENCLCGQNVCLVQHWRNWKPRPLLT